MSILSSILNSLLNGGQVHDYAHAAQTFRTNNYARAPKSKYLFQVNFVLSSEAPVNVSTREITYLVKNIDLPKFIMDVKDLNQYNRHTYIQDRIKYEPITIKFHDDNQNGLRELWQDYYNYYYTDGQYALNDYNYDDRYQTRLHSSWGLDSGATTPFFSAIEIYSLNRGVSNKITLMSPVITSFSHDNHDYSEGQGIMEATMQVRYNGVVYEDGYASGTPGFADGQFYDTNPSNISGQYSGQYVDPITGYLVQQPQDFNNRYNTLQHGSFGFANPQDVMAFDQGQSFNQSSNNSLSPIEIQSIINNNAQSINQNSNLVFPNNVPLAPIYTNNPADIIPINGVTAISDGQFIYNSNELGTTYDAGSLQQTLFNRGYSDAQINAANDFVGSLSDQELLDYGSQVGLTNINTISVVLAQKFIENPSNVTNIGTINYGQGSTVPSFITQGFQNQNATYNSLTWQQILRNEGFPSSKIAIAETHISQLNYPPNSDLVSIARSYITYSDNVNTVIV